MKERPILMSAPMVRALIDGRKTQTRRVVSHEWGHMFRGRKSFDRRSGKDDFVCFSEPYQAIAKEPVWFYSWGNVRWLRSPYGVPGDRLWVKEGIERGPDGDSVQYRANGSVHHDANWPWKSDSLPSMFMPRGLCRITLEVTEVRVQRVQEISEADALAEGCAPFRGLGDSAPVWNYRALWDSLNAKRGYSWESNPWVWAITFKKEEADAL